MPDDTAPAQYYFDLPGEGLSPETSHPRFVQLAPETFYGEGDDFAPFGSDDGNDALRDLEAWYEFHADGEEAADMLTELIDGWGYELPDGVLDFTDAQLSALIGGDDMNESYLASVARACVAVALGQFKIEGRISSALHTEARRGLRVLRVLHGNVERYPDWPHRGEALRGLDDVERVLEQERGAAPLDR